MDDVSDEDVLLLGRMVLAGIAHVREMEKWAGKSTDVNLSTFCKHVVTLPSTGEAYNVFVYAVVEEDEG